eukprot:177157_1
MAHKRTFTDSLDDTDNIYSAGSSPLLKKRKVDNDDSVARVDASALLTILCYDQVVQPSLQYTPYWICGNSSDERFNLTEWGSRSPLTPDAFLSECQYPFLRFSAIPPRYHLSQPYHSFYCNANEYLYDHCLCTQYETKNAEQISAFLATKMSVLQTKYLSKKKSARGCSLIDFKNNLLCHLFIIKQYISKYNAKWNELLHNADDHRLALPNSILKHALSPFVYELNAYKTIDFLDDNALINQTEWFNYAFYFIEFTSYEWQKFFYECVLSDGTYNEAIMNMLRKHDKLTTRHFKYWKFTSLSLRLSSKKLTAQRVGSWIDHSVRSDDDDLFDFCLKLFDSHSIQPKPFWGTLILKAFKHIESDGQLDMFRKLCRKMKQHCDGKQDIMDASIKKFNAKACNWQCIDYNNDVKFKMLNAMEEIIEYDVNCMVSYCCSTDNLDVIQEFIEEGILDRQICKENGSVDMINEKLNFQNTKRNKIDSNEEFRDVFNEFIRGGE